MKNILLILAIIVIAGVGGIYYLSSGSQLIASKSSASLQTASTQNQVMFSVDAKRFQFTPDTIRVKKGQQVKIVINNLDTTHGINLSDFNASGNDYIEFSADKTGEFVFRCNTFCGDGHAIMQGKVIVTD